VVIPETPLARGGVRHRSSSADASGSTAPDGEADLLESRVVAPDVLADGFAGVFALDKRQQFLETQLMRSV